VDGVIALVGSGEFTPAMAEVDRALLAATGSQRPRVTILPTASWPDGERVFRRWAELGAAHFDALGADVLPVPLRDRAGAEDPEIVAALEAADLVYLSGGKPGHLLDALEGTPAGAAIRSAHGRGAVLAGCSAGAMVLGGHQLRVRRARRRLPIGWTPSLGIVPGVIVVPHYDTIPETLLAPFALMAPRDAWVVGIDEETAFIGRAGTWQVRGPGRVTIWRGGRRERLREPAIVRV
jgi:cyanophycinase